MIHTKYQISIRCQYQLILKLVRTEISQVLFTLTEEMRKGVEMGLILIVSFDAKKTYFIAHCLFFTALIISKGLPDLALFNFWDAPDLTVEDIALFPIDSWCCLTLFSANQKKCCTFIKFCHNLSKELRCFCHNIDNIDNIDVVWHSFLQTRKSFALLSNFVIIWAKSCEVSATQLCEQIRQRYKDRYSKTFLGKN